MAVAEYPALAFFMVYFDSLLLLLMRLAIPPTTIP
jgi:hypothetical protein